MSIVEIFNARVKGSITVMKLDSISKKPIEGAVLGLFDHDTDMLYKAVSSNASGKAIFEDIPAGDYYIWEIKPAFGYLHNTKILADNAGCVRTHQPRGYSDILYTMGALANQHSNKTASANARELNLLASLFYLVEFSALTIDSNNPDIIVDENGTLQIMVETEEIIILLQYHLQQLHHLTRTTTMKITIMVPLTSLSYL